MSVIDGKVILGKSKLPELSVGRHLRWLSNLRGNRVRFLAGVALLLVILAAIFAPSIAPHDPIEQDLPNRLAPPAWYATGRWEHILGTDSLGRDTLSRMLFGARISLMVSFSVATSTACIGTLLGLVSGYYGGRVDQLIMRVVDILLACPFMLLAIAVIGVVGPSLLNIVVILTVTGWTRYARLVRGQILSLREREFIEAARAIGCQPARLIFRHLLPNIITPVIVVGSLHLAGVIVTESSLSFLGLGVQPPTPTWGGMLSSGRNYIWTAWWLSTFPGLAIALTVLAINLLGDWLREIWDPRLRV